ncbi:hypothetical protein [Clostridium sp. DJ247]|nr:hypothetical protein [Clostridium sp. DJ247]MBC2579024.1 hypothetical protein [Clostridium sp. DJ247]
MISSSYDADNSHICAVAQTNFKDIFSYIKRKKLEDIDKNELPQGLTSD